MDIHIARWHIIDVFTARRHGGDDNGDRDGDGDGDRDREAEPERGRGRRQIDDLTRTCSVVGIIEAVV